jgi:uncharacterized LabA/DUF88 family protein
MESGVNLEKTEKSLILIDDSNLWYGNRKYGWEIDYRKFYHWIHRSFNVLEIYFFGGLITKNAFFSIHSNKTLDDFIKEKSDRKLFFQFLKSVGYKVKYKPVTCLYDNMKAVYTRKCNFDVEITIIALDRINNYKELVLCSGDGDFTKLLKYTKGKYKKTVIITHKDRLNSELKKTANRVIFLENVKKEIIK